MEETQSSSNKPIAKNTLMLSVRLAFTMIVSLYTSRVVLNTLGVEDYGIYSVVGGVVGLFTFLNAAMGGATSRFLTFELGRGDFQRLKDTFSSSLIVHIGIALGILLLAETVGLWFVCNKLVIPQERMYAAHWVYQLSILSMAVSVTQVPYTASIISHEKFNVLAYIEMTSAALKLAIVYLLLIGDLDKLILYAVLVLAVSILMAFVSRVYCLRKFEECRFRWVWNPKILKPMLTFSGWDLYNNMSQTARRQGMVMVVNMFFGPILNASVNIATIVEGQISAVAYNIINAVRPQIIKNYAQGNIAESVRLIKQASKYTIVLFTLFSVPFVLEADYILRLWLGDNLPPYVTMFVIYSLFTGCLIGLQSIMNIGIGATGNIKKVSFYSGTICLLNLVVLYVFLKLGFKENSIYVIYLVFAFGVYLANVISLKKEIPSFSIVSFLIKDTVLPIIMALIVYFLCVFVKRTLFVEDCLISLIGLLIFNAIITIGFSFLVVLSKEERRIFREYVLLKLKKKA